jgi:HK97 gp10 family phage protein
MGVEISTKSIDLNLKRMAAKEKKIRNKGLKKAAQFVAERLEENTPYDPTTKHKHLKDDVVISNVNDMGQIKVGYGKETAWRAKFVEFGTMGGQRIKPQGFMQRTEEETRDDVMKIMVNEFKKGLSL